MKKFLYEECVCHPLPRFLNFRMYKMDYLQEIDAPSLGVCHVTLARPWKGLKDVGFCIKILGRLYIVTLWRTRV